MMATARGRTTPCDEQEARLRLKRAHEFIEVANLVADEQDPEDYSLVYASAAGALAVLAAIAAADAACCKDLGRQSRGQSHDEAVQLLREITPGGKDAAKKLGSVLSVKRQAQYGALALRGSDLQRRHARALIDFAEQVLQR